LLLRNDILNTLGLGGRAAGYGDSFISETHFLSKCAVRDPFGRCARGCLLQHLVDLLQGESLGFWDKEVRERERDAAERSPEEKNLRTHIGIAIVSADKVWGDYSNDL
jgi:hypothetical protein